MKRLTTRAIAVTLGFLLCLGVDAQLVDKEKRWNVIWIPLSISALNPDQCRDQHPLLLILNEHGSIVMNGGTLAPQQVRPVFRKILQGRSDKRVFLRPSGKLRYAAVARVLNELSASDSSNQVIVLTPALESAPCAPPVPLRYLR